MILTLFVAFIANAIAQSEQWKRLTAEFEGQVMWKDYAVALVLALMFPLVRYALDKTLFTAVAKLLVIRRHKRAILERRRALAPEGLDAGKQKGIKAVGGRLLRWRRRKEKGGAEEEEEKTKKEKKSTAVDLTPEDVKAIDAKVEKFKESFWKALVYASFTFYGFYFMSSKSWFYDRSHFWHLDADQDHCCPKACTNETWPECTTSKFTFDVKFYYMAELGYYLQGIVSLVFWETRRKDFGVMMAHHVVTVILIVFSHYTRLLRIGTMVLLLHDISDIPLELAKASRYANMKSLCHAFFAVFFLVWVASRLVYFPGVIIRTALFEVPLCSHISLMRNYSMNAFNTLLLTLLSFHVYWTYLISKILHKAVFKKAGVSDVREDSDTDDD
jgi:ceramide synthetase